GGTGTGKTTLLSAMLTSLPSDQRLVIVEDSREIWIDHPHWVSMEARAANSEGKGSVTLTDLVRQCLRMRPDRIVLGEVRGAELRDLLMALNTGHEGGCGTVHANGV
ncbi:pilus assembly protein CpaF, partial [Xanthomonas citri pv. citri]|nr:pilus assembly protein CpaF [Xanthomonas citri pv. citri]